MSAGSCSVTSTFRSQAASRVKQTKYTTCPSEHDLPYGVYAWEKKMNTHWASYWRNIFFHLFEAIINSVSPNSMLKNPVGKILS